jgi:hypothetical protein
MKSCILIVAVLTLAASEARAGWVRVSQNYQISDTQHIYDTGAPDLFVEGWLTKGAGGHARGGVAAEDRSSFGAIAQIQMIGTGFSYESWKHQQPGVGEVELTKSAEISGVARLTNSDCAAGAFGTAMAKHVFDGVPNVVTASLSHCASETVNGQLGTLTTGFQGSGVTINFNVVHHGTGTYPDDGGGLQPGSGYKCPVVFYEEELRCALMLTAWANEALLSSDARGDAEGEGYTYLQAILLTHTTCP